MPGRFELKPTLAKIWHAPDNFRIMDPLPPMHRRGIIAAAIVLVIGILLPSNDSSDTPVVTRDAQLDFQSQSQPPTEAQLQAQLVARKTILARSLRLRRNRSRKENQTYSRRLNNLSPRRSLFSRIAGLTSNGAPIA